MLSWLHGHEKPITADRHAIKEAGIKQIELARLTGVSRSAASQWVNGDITRVSADNLFAIADATGFSPRWLALGEGPQRNLSTEERAKKLLDLYQRLDERGQATVFRTAEAESHYVTDGECEAGEHCPSKAA